MRSDDSPKDVGSPTRNGRDLRDADTRFMIIFTDLDGTLLDRETYDWVAAEPALDACRRRGVPVVMVSSKTRAEMERVRIELGLNAPFISENGGGVFFPKKSVREPPPKAVDAGNLWVWPLGPSYRNLVRALRDMRHELGWKIRGFSEMPPEEISRLTGLNREACLLAARREYDEPFVLEKPYERVASMLEKAAASRGLRVSAGGRFFHLPGKNGKAEAVQKLISWYKKTYPRICAIGLGDSPNDFGMLKAVNNPVLIRSDRRFLGIEKDIPGVRITSETGPRGWNVAVLDLLQDLKGGSF